MGAEYWAGLREAVERVKELANELALNLPPETAVDSPAFLLVRSLDRLVAHVEAAIQEHERQQEGV